MGKISLVVPHSLGKDEARRRLEKLCGEWADKYGMRTRWTGDSAAFGGKVMGMSVDGQFSVLDDKIDVEATDPGFLLREKAKRFVAERLTAYLDPSAPAV